MIKNISYIVLISLAFCTGFLIYQTSSEFKIGNSSKECPNTFPEEGVYSTYTYNVEFENDFETLICLYDNESLLLTRSIYIIQFFVGEENNITFNIDSGYNDDGLIYFKEYTYSTYPVHIVVYKLYDEDSLDLIVHREVYSNLQLGIAHEYAEYVSDRSKNIENVFERIIEIFDNESLD